jgi:hypothetical protein
MTDWDEKHQKLLGKLVCVELGVNPAGEPVYAKGRLASFDSEGSFTLQDETRLVTWCWPMLDVTELCPSGCGCRIGTDDADRSECGCDAGCCE